LGEAGGTRGGTGESGRSGESERKRSDKEKGTGILWEEEKKRQIRNKR